MTTFATQRQLPDVARAEERLLGILAAVGRTRIPELAVGDFYPDLGREEGEGRPAPWEEQLGVRLVLRILDQIVCEQFSKQEELATKVERMAEWKKKVLVQVDKLKTEKKILEDEVATLRRQKEDRSSSQEEIDQLKLGKISAETEADKLRIDNKNLKNKLHKIVGQYQQMAAEVMGSSTDAGTVQPEAPTNVSNSGLKETSGSDSGNLTRKRKSPSSSPEPRSRPLSQVFPRSRRGSPQSTQAHAGDASFVPDTLRVAAAASPASRSTLPLAAVSRVPDTPTKTPSPTIEQVPSPDQEPASPTYVKQKRVTLPGNKNVRLVLRNETLQGSNFEMPESFRASRLEAKKKKKMALEQPDSGTRKKEEELVVSSITAKKVGKIQPSAQSEIDKKSFQDLDQDFASEKMEKTPPKKKSRHNYFPSDTDSDFESPNLLVKTRKPKAVKENLERLVKKSKENLQKVVPSSEVDHKDSEIDVFVSQDEIVKVNAKPATSKLKSVKAKNRWGVDLVEMDALSDSEKKKYTSNKQSKLDGFFNKNKNPPRQQNGDFIRVNQADTDLDRALKLSREVSSNKDDAGKVDEEKDEVGCGSSSGPPRPQFAHIGPVVRKKEERRRLNGYSCPECDEYYQQKLEEGLTKDQILQLMNKCSKHRGLFKPPLTPEKYWDPDIIEDDPSDPRVKTQPGGQLRTRAVRRAEKRNKMRGLELEEK